MFGEHPVEDAITDSKKFDQEGIVSVVTLIIN